MASMERCPSCNATVRIKNTRQCPSCGADLTTDDDAPTRMVVQGQATGERTRPESRRVRLVVVLGRTRLQEHDHDRGTISIGRDAIQDVVLDNPSVSRRHCQVRFVPETGAFVVEDLGSPNGTLLNGAQVTTPSELAPGDEIGVGKFSVLFNPSPTQLAGLEVRPGAAAATVTHEEVATTYQDGGELDRVRQEHDIERGAHLRTLAGQRYALGETLVLGRGRSADVPLSGWLVGRRHAVIERSVKGLYTIRRVGHLRAVRVNGKPVHGVRVLVSHDRITIGKQLFQFYPAV